MLRDIIQSEFRSAQTRLLRQPRFHSSNLRRVHLFRFATFKAVRNNLSRYLRKPAASEYLPSLRQNELQCGNKYQLSLWLPRVEIVYTLIIYLLPISNIVITLHQFKFLFLFSFLYFVTKTR